MGSDYEGRRGSPSPSAALHLPLYRSAPSPSALSSPFLSLPPLPLCCSITSTIKVQIWMRLKKGTQSVDPQAQHHLNSLILPGAVYLPHHRHHFLPTSLINARMTFLGCLSCCGAILDCFPEKQIVLNNSRRYLLTKPPSCFAFFLFQGDSTSNSI